MGFLKKYPVFSALVILLLLVLGGGIYLVIVQEKKLEQAKRDYRSAESTIENVSRGIPYDEEGRIRVAPTVENRRVLEERLETIRTDIEDIRRTMGARTDGILTDPADEFTFLPKLQEFINNMKALAAGDEGKEDDVLLNSDEAFGFARYARIGDQPETDMIPELDRQQQVLEYILRQLFASDPSAILSVERELIEVKGEETERRSRRDDVRGDDVFTIEELVTARSNEFIDTFAFRLVFTGRTDVLRTFLNLIARFELPLIVRSVEVVPATEDDQPEIDDSDSADGDPLANLFGGGNTASEEEEEEIDESRKPIITENQSRFTVVIEFVELRMDNVDEDEQVEAGEDAA